LPFSILRHLIATKFRAANLSRRRFQIIKGAKPAGTRFGVWLRGRCYNEHPLSFVPMRV